MIKWTFTGARGNYFFDGDGYRYLDFTSGGIFQAPFGANCTDLRLAVSKTAMNGCYGAHYDNPYAEKLKDMLKERTGYESVCLFTTGSEANEAFWRACIVHTGKPGIWGGLGDPDECGIGQEEVRADAMHGVTLGSLIMAGRITWGPLGVFPELGGGRFGIPPENTACRIMEPFHSPSGQFHKEKPTIERQRANTKEFPDMPICLDEIQGGMGRTGRFFAHEWYPRFEKPDFVTLGKGLGGGYPVSALLGPKAVLEDKGIVRDAHLHSTHSGHPAMAGAGVWMMENLTEKVVNEVYNKGLTLESLLKDCGVRFHAGKGLMAGLEFENDVKAARVARECFENGLVVCDTGRKWVKLAPAYTITGKELEKGVKVLRRAIDQVLGEEVMKDA